MTCIARQLFCWRPDARRPKPDHHGFFPTPKLGEFLAEPPRVPFERAAGTRKGAVSFANIFASPFQQKAEEVEEVVNRYGSGE